MKMKCSEQAWRLWWKKKNNTPSIVVFAWCWSCKLNRWSAPNGSLREGVFGSRRSVKGKWAECSHCTLAAFFTMVTLSLWFDSQQRSVCPGPSEPGTGPLGPGPAQHSCTARALSHWLTLSLSISGLCLLLHKLNLQPSSGSRLGWFLTKQRPLSAPHHEFLLCLWIAAHFLLFSCSCTVLLPVSGTVYCSTVPIFPCICSSKQYHFSVPCIFCHLLSSGPWRRPVNIFSYNYLS